MTESNSKIVQPNQFVWSRTNKHQALTSQNALPYNPINFDDLMRDLQGYKTDIERQIAQLQQTQAATEARSCHYAELYEHAPVGYTTLNSEGIILEINLTGTKMLGGERPQVANKNFSEFIDQDCQEQWKQTCANAIKSSKKQIAEFKICQHSGASFYARVDCLYTKVNENYSVMRVIFTDISDFKKKEEELRIAAITFEMQEAIVVANINKTIKTVNQAFNQITGYRIEQAVGKTTNFLKSGLHDQQFYRNIWKVLIQEGFWQGEIWIKKQNGDLLPIWQTITAVRGKDQKISHYVGAFTDITVQKQAEKVLLDSRDRLKTQVVSTQEELEKIKEETAEINTALSVMFKHRELDKTEAQIALSQEIEAIVLPLLKKLKAASNGRIQSTRLIGILESNLQQLAKSYGRAANLSSAYQKLSPIETQVAAMIRQGLPTKVIASALNISGGTVSIHRKHIRKKLSLEGKSNNLYSYLQSLSE